MQRLCLAALKNGFVTLFTLHTEAVHDSSEQCMLRDLLPGLGGKNCPTSAWPPAPSSRLVLWPPGALC